MALDPDCEAVNSTPPWPKDVTSAAFQAHSNFFIGADKTAYLKALLSIRTFVGAGLVISLLLPRTLTAIAAGLSLLPQLLVTIARATHLIGDPLRNAHPVLRGRWTANIEGSFCVFLIGVILNGHIPNKEMDNMKRAFDDMVKELESDPEKFGYLGGHGYSSQNIRVDGAMAVQYWRTQEQLMAYARNGMRKHIPAMNWSSKVVKASDHIGFWHESFHVEDGAYECIYVNCPQMLLGKASSVIPAVGTRRTARGRLGKTDGDDLDEHKFLESYFA